MKPLGTTPVGSEAARRHLPELIERARRGEATVIQKHGVPVAALVPLDQCPQPQGGSLLGLRGSGQGCWGASAADLVDNLRRDWP